MTGWRRMGVAGWLQTREQRRLGEIGPLLPPDERLSTCNSTLPFSSCPSPTLPFRCHSFSFSSDFETSSRLADCTRRDAGRDETDRSETKRPLTREQWSDQAEFKQRQQHNRQLHPTLRCTHSVPSEPAPSTATATLRLPLSAAD
jgi:hypothetical protein